MSFEAMTILIHENAYHVLTRQKVDSKSSILTNQLKKLYSLKSTARHSVFMNRNVISLKLKLKQK